MKQEEWEIAVTGRRGSAAWAKVFAPRNVQSSRPAVYPAATLPPGAGLFGVALPLWPRPALTLAGLAGNLAVVFLYVLTRTRGAPVGPHVGEVEAAYPLGMSATVAELGIVVLLVTMPEGRTRERALWVLLFLGAALWAPRLVRLLP